MRRSAPRFSRRLTFPYPVVPIVRHHHENWDGTGYPDGLRGEAIPIGARILAVVDCFDALTSDRPYRSRMTDEEAIAILLERRGTMYNDEVVDTFIAAHARLMPSETTMHPAARAVGGARSRDRAAPSGAPSAAAEPAGPAGPPGIEEMLGVSSLARAVAGDANVNDVGALSWMMLKSMVPASAMGLFVLDERTDRLVCCFAAGTHASIIRAFAAARGDGVVGWVAAHRRSAVNAEPAIDFGRAVTSLDPPLLSACVLPLVHDGNLVAVLAVYGTTRQAFGDDHVRLLDLLAPRLSAPFDIVRPQTSQDRRIGSTFKLLRGARTG